MDEGVYMDVETAEEHRPEADISMTVLLATDLEGIGSPLLTL